MSLPRISKSEAQRVIRSQFGSLCRIEVDETEVRAIAEDGELIVGVLLEGNPDPYRQMLSITCQLERKTEAKKRAMADARQRNADIIRGNLLRGPPKEILQ